MVHRMVLMGCQGTRSPLFGAQPTEGIKALHAVYREPSIETFRAFFDTMVYDGSMVSDAILEERAHGVRQEHIDAWMASQDAPHRSLALELDTVDVPTLIVHGRNDRVVPFESGIALLSELPHSELHAFNRCGHWVQYEHAEVFNELVLNFFARD
jgi:2-hydroxy-6-oxonona-2,4-dienedioate hydrolase